MSRSPWIVVVGGGHAGVEACLAAARLGARVTLVTLDRRAVGRMSCNPAVGGLAKGQLAREVDALGGVMGEAADHAAQQFRMLNTRKGPAVRGPRVQVDKERYAAFVSARVAATEGVELLEGKVHAVHERAGRLASLELSDGSVLRPDAAVLTTGTFLRGLMHVGDKVSAGGRVGEAPAHELSASLSSLGLELVRLKTGTPPRVDLRSVDLSGLEQVEGPPGAFALSSRVTPPTGRVSVASHLLRTHEALHDIVRANLQASPYGRGALEGTGPRYCPSLEDKVVRFPDKASHRLFVERETRDGPSLYLNGMSNCLPAATQIELVRALPGFENARLLRPGYAVEYDALPAWQLRPSLECRAVGGLFLAGQINGTSGYEEAAAQGLMAGLNATRLSRGESPAVLARHEAYVGVLLDDLVTSSPREPYRMFTSRAEYRLSLRQDNADRRLAPRAHAWGLVDDAFADGVAHRERVLADAQAKLSKAGRRRLCQGAELDESFVEANGLAGFELDPRDREQLQLDVAYAGYVQRQERTVQKMAELADLALPEDTDYAAIGGLKSEAREVLQRVQPVDLAQASRLAGVTQADLALLMLSRRGPAHA